MDALLRRLGEQIDEAIVRREAARKDYEVLLPTVHTFVPGQPLAPPDPFDLTAAQKARRRLDWEVDAVRAATLAYQGYQRS